MNPEPGDIVSVPWADYEGEIDYVIMKVNQSIWAVYLKEFGPVNIKFEDEKWIAI